ncbi:hypothetical protein KXV48_006285, partial [Aspergillus fumigatus]
MAGLDIQQDYAASEEHPLRFYPTTENDRYSYCFTQENGGAQFKKLRSLNGDKRFGSMAVCNGEATFK